MGRNRKPSKKRSAASSTDKLLEQTVFYFDESIYSRVLATAMIESGAQVRTPADLAGFGASDEKWLPLAAASDWLVLMRDQRVRYRELEKRALNLAGAGAFVFTGGQATAADTADIVCRLLRKFANISRSERKPFLFTFGFGTTTSRIKLKS
jgi:PIN domain-containing protein